MKAGVKLSALVVSRWPGAFYAEGGDIYATHDGCDDFCDGEGRGHRACCVWCSRELSLRNAAWDIDAGEPNCSECYAVYLADKEKAS